jgi:hypothetical protein
MFLRELVHSGNEQGEPAIRERVKTLWKEYPLTYDRIAELFDRGIWVLASPSQERDPSIYTLGPYLYLWMPGWRIPVVQAWYAQLLTIHMYEYVDRDEASLDLHGVQAEILLYAKQLYLNPPLSRCHLRRMMSMRCTIPPDYL